MATGIIPIDKPQGWTSQDVTARLRRVFATRRIGHGGTLDPMATGVLPVFVGRATRAVEFFEHAGKEYVATLHLGLVTDTQDITGTVRQEQDVHVSRAELEAVLPQFRGNISQIPPMYSAIKVDGRKLYELARQGKEVARSPREVTIHALELLDFDGREAKIRVDCSKGTYIRTLCHDIGMTLGCGGCMSSLRRTRAGSYGIEQAIALEELLERAERQEKVEQLLLPIDSMFQAMPAWKASPAQEKKCRNGAPFLAKAAAGNYRIYGGDGEFLALGRCDGQEMATIKSFFEVT